MKPKKKTLAVIGCGRVGASIASAASAKGQNVIVIDMSASSFDRLDENFSGYTFEGDATDIAVLRQSGAEMAGKVVLTTGNDNVNLYLARLFAVVYAIPAVYVRFDDPSMAYLIDDVPSIKGVYPFALTYKELLGEEEGLIK